MKTFKPIVIMLWIAVFVVAGSFFLTQRQGHHESVHKDIYYCPMHPYYTSDRPGNCPICNMKLVKKEKSSETKVAEETVKTEKKILYWTDPMIPGYKAAGPGKSPMGMDLVPVYEQEKKATAQAGGSPEGYASVDLSNAQRQLIGIKTVEVVKKPLMRTVRAYGYVSHDVDLYKIQNEFIDAYIEYINIYRDYKRVIDRRRSWEAHRDIQIKALEAEHKLLLLGLNEGQIDKLRHIDRWQIWNQPELLFTKANNNYWVFAQIFEDDIGYVDVAQKVEVEISAFKEKIPGIVRSVGGAVDPESRTIRVLIELPDYKGELTIGMLANIQMPVELDGNLLVPKEAVMDLGDRKVVFIIGEQGVYRPVEIEVGAQGEGYYAVTKGLKEGERVVVDGNFLLDSESRLRSSFEQAAEGGQSHVH